MTWTGVSWEQPTRKDSRVNSSAKTAEIFKALVEVQSELPVIAKTATNPYFQSRYAPLAEVVAAVSPVLTAHGLCVTQWPRIENGQPVLTTILAHSSGEWLSGDMPLLLAKNDPQGQGSAITYARRYAYMSIVGVVADEDDDGNAASRREPAQRVPAVTPIRRQLNELTSEQKARARAKWRELSLPSPDSDLSEEEQARAQLVLLDATS